MEVHCIYHGKYRETVCSERSLSYLVVFYCNICRFSIENFRCNFSGIFVYSKMHDVNSVSICNLEFLLEGYAKCLTPTNKSDLNGILKYIMHNIKRRMIVVMVTDTEGILSLQDNLLGQITMVHDVLLINVSDADIFGKKVYNVDDAGYIPPFISQSKAIRKEQEKIQQDMEKQASIKLNRYGIPWVGVDTANRVDGKIAELLEKNKTVN